MLSRRSGGSGNQNIYTVKCSPQGIAQPQPLHDAHNGPVIGASVHAFGSCEHSPILSPVYRSFSPSLRRRNGLELWPSQSPSPCLLEPPWKEGFFILFSASTAQQILTAGPRANHIEKLVKYWQADGTHGPLENKATCLDLRISLKEFCPPGCCSLHYVPEEAGSFWESPHQGIQERY